MERTVSHQQKQPADSSAPDNLKGLSYSLTLLPATLLLPLPTAATASQTLSRLRNAAATHLSGFSAIAAASYGLAFLLSPRSLRHPYLLYAAILGGTSGLAGRWGSDHLRGWWYVGSSPEDVWPPVGPSSLSSRSSTGGSSAGSPVRIHPGARSRTAEIAAGSRSMMEASYEVLPAGGVVGQHGDSLSESHGSATSEDETEAARRDMAASAATEVPAASVHPSAAASSLNGEGVSEDVRAYVRARAVQTAVAGLAFLMAVVGIWGDGVADVLVVEI